MGRELQEKLAQYVISGGGLLLYGEIPQFDMEGLECKVLAQCSGYSGHKCSQRKAPLLSIGGSSRLGSS